LFPYAAREKDGSFNSPGIAIRLIMTSTDSFKLIVREHCESLFRFAMTLTRVESGARDNSELRLAGGHFVTRSGFSMIWQGAPQTQSNGRNQQTN
jgi:hypothetical protein